MSLIGINKKKIGYAQLPRTLLILATFFVVIGAFFAAFFYGKSVLLTAYGIGLMIIGSSVIVYPPYSNTKTVVFTNANGEKNYVAHFTNSSLNKSPDLEVKNVNAQSQSVVDLTRPEGSSILTEKASPVSVDALKNNSIKTNLAFCIVISSLIFIALLSLYSLNVSFLEVYISIFALAYFVCLATLQPNKNFYDLPAYVLFVSFIVIIFLKMLEILR